MLVLVPIAHLLKRSRERERERERERVSEVDSRWWDGIYQIDSVYMRASRCCVVGFTFWAIVALAPQPMVQWPLGLFFW